MAFAQHKEYLTVGQSLAECLYRMEQHRSTVQHTELLGQVGTETQATAGRHYYIKCIRQ